jgi:hypothetical protein
MPRHRHQEFVKSLKQIDAEKPADVDLRLIVGRTNCKAGSKMGYAIGVTVGSTPPPAGPNFGDPGASK